MMGIVVLAACVPTLDGVDFGSDDSKYAFNGFCDDPRFNGTGMAVETSEAAVLGDATDCYAFYKADLIRLIDDDGIPRSTPKQCDAIDFGDNSSKWADDQVCDDPRFIGLGRDSKRELKTDANDCRALCYDHGIGLMPN
jgi:hypothetical protein